MSRRGLSLSETVVSLFLMVSACLIFITLMHSMLRYETRSRRLAQASCAAERRLALLQAQLRALGSTWNEASNWTSLQSPQAELDAPGVTTSALIAEKPVLSPCTSLESGFATAQQRSLSHSLLQLEVVSAWGNGSDQRVVLEGAFAGPPPAIHHIEVKQVGGASSPLPAHSSMQMQARAFDSSGAVIQDVAFAWYVKALTGSARLQPDPSARLGQQCGLTNEVLRPNGSVITFGPDPLSGALRKCRAQVRARWVGQDQWGESDDILLRP